MLTTITLDVNNQLYPVAFIVIDYENNNSLMYVILKLKEAI